MPLSTFQSFVGIAKELTRGVTVAPADFIPVKTVNLVDMQGYQDDLGMRGSQVKSYNKILTTTWGAYDFAGDVFADTIGYPLAGILGDVTVSGTATAPTGTLSAASAVGATSVSSSVSFPSGTVIQIDTGVNAETVTTSGAPTGTGPYTIPVPALVKAHASGVAVTAVVNPITHQINVRNSGDGQPPSYTLTDFDASQARYIPAAQFSDVSLLFNSEGLLNYTAKAAGYISTTTTTPTRSYTAVTPYANWQAVVTIAGGPSTRLLDGTCDIKRTVTPFHTISSGTAPYRLWSGPVAVTGKFSFITEAAEVELGQYLTNAQPAVDLNFSQGTGVTATKVQLHFTKCAFITGTNNRSKDYVTTEVTYEALANTTDIGFSGGYSPIQVNLNNAKPAGTYA